MGIVAHQPGVVRARKFGKFLQRRQIAVHRKDAVGHDQGMGMATAMGRQQFARMADIVVPELLDRPA